MGILRVAHTKFQGEAERNVNHDAIQMLPLPFIGMANLRNAGNEQQAYAIKGAEFIGMFLEWKH